jgi:HD-like signal output (HDOD) protein
MDEQPAVDPRLGHWITLLGGREIPVLQRSIDALAVLRQREDSVNPRQLSQIVLRDPMLTVRVVRYLQTHSSRRRLAEITTVEHAVMMLGISPFFAAFSSLRSVERTLRHNQPALDGLMRVVSRARAAALYAGAWAAQRADIETDEVVVAALLHDLAELLMWCFSPDTIAAIEKRKQHEPGLRSMQAQQEALGFPLSELQVALARSWQLPALLTKLMGGGDASARVENVRLAVALARHTAEDWSNTALPDDIEGAARLLKLAPADVYAEIFDMALYAVAERDGYGKALRQSFLPPLPDGASEHDATPAERAARARRNALRWLTCLANGVPVKGHPRRGMVSDSAHDVLAAIAAVLDAMTRGLAADCAAFLAVDAVANQIAAKYLSSSSPGGAATWAATESPVRAAVKQACAAREIIVDGANGLCVVPVLRDDAVAALVAAVARNGALAIDEGVVADLKRIGERLSDVLALAPDALLAGANTTKL